MNMLYTALLYACLASPEWATRESAERQLVHRVSAWPWMYGKVVEMWSGGATSPEVSSRALRPCRVYRSWLANNYVPTGIPVWPCADFFPRRVGLGLDIRDRQAVPPAPCRSYSDPADCGPYWRRWRQGTERMARGMIRDGVPEEQVTSLVRRMWLLEIECGSDCDAADTVSSWLGRPWAGGVSGLTVTDVRGSAAVNKPPTQKG